MSAGVAAVPLVPILGPVLKDVAEICQAEGRADLERAVRIAASRLDRAETIVCVVGEYKQGKSTLINALLGEDVCPVDDDLATSALTILTYADEPRATVYRTQSEGQVKEEIPFGRIADFISELGDLADRKHVDLVEIGIPNRLVADGLSLVDTPGVGGFGPAYSASILGFLPVVDGLVFVSDASAELSPHELRFLSKAREACPNVLFALTKVDLYPSWRQIAGLDRERLAILDYDGEQFPLAAPLRRLALDTADREVDNESGYPALIDAIRSRVIETAREQAGRRALGDAVNALAQIESSLRPEETILRHPEDRELFHTLSEAERRLRGLRDAGSRWSVALGDAFVDLRMEVDHRIREIFRGAVEDADRKIDHLDPSSEWDGFAEQFQAELTEALSACVESIHATSVEIGSRIGAMIAEDAGPTPTSDPAIRFDPKSMTGGLVRPGARRETASRLEWGLGALRGAQGGGYTIAWLGGVVGLTISAPLALGAGALFAAKFVIDERKRQTERRRQEARAAVRRFSDGLQVEVARRVQQNIANLQRGLRDHFQARIQELHNAQVEVARATREALEADDASREHRLNFIPSTLERIARIRGKIEQLGTTELR